MTYTKVIPGFGLTKVSAATVIATGRYATSNIDDASKRYKAGLEPIHEFEVQIWCSQVTTPLARDVIFDGGMAVEAALSFHCGIVRVIRLAKLRRMQFGRKSEKIERQIEQLELQLEDLEANRAESVDTAEKQAATANTIPPATKPSRRALPTHLPRETKIHEPAEQACPECGGTRRWCSPSSRHRNGAKLCDRDGGGNGPMVQRFVV